MNPETAAWFATWWPLWSPFAVLVVGGSITGIWVLINRRGGEKAARKNPLPPTWPEMWARIDAQDTKIDAQGLEIESLKASLREAGEKYDELEEAHAALVRSTAVKDGQMDELIQHILSLELLIPTPPGPLERPAWIARRWRAQNPNPT